MAPRRLPPGGFALARDSLVDPATKEGLHSFILPIKTLSRISFAYRKWRRTRGIIKVIAHERIAAVTVDRYRSTAALDLSLHEFVN